MAPACLQVRGLSCDTSADQLEQAFSVAGEGKGRGSQLALGDAASPRASLPWERRTCILLLTVFLSACPALLLPALLPCPAGQIRRLRLVTEEDGRSAGVAFIEFADPRGLGAALALGDSLALDGQRVTVAPANRNLAVNLSPEQGQQQQGQQQQGQQQQQPPPPEGAVEEQDCVGEKKQEHAPQQQLDSSGGHHVEYVPSQQQPQQEQPQQQLVQLLRGSHSSASASSLPAGERPGQLQHPGRAGPSQPLSSHGSGPLSSLAMAGDVSPDTLFVRPLG